MSSTLSFAAILAAAGSGSRAGGVPKQFRDLVGRPVIRWSAEALLSSGADPLIVVTSPAEGERAAEALESLPVIWATGGARRSDSVRNGLGLVPDRAEAVLVHDAARPLLTPEHVARLLAALRGAEGALPGLAVADTLQRVIDGRVAETVPRDGLYRAQTPQAFRRTALIDAYAALPPDLEPTDDAEVVRRAGGRVTVIPGDPRLHKLTYEEDFAVLEQMARPAMMTRVGLGLDAHRFEAGDAVTICGVRVPHAQALQGHSDADVGLHAITDALFGAAALGDIGDWFPPTDDRWKGADSALFLREARAAVEARGGRVVSVDVTIVGERPKVKPHREAMRARIAEILELPLGRVSVKATTTEGMGFTGREEGLAAQAVATIEMPA